MNFMAVSSSSLGLALHFNLKRGGTKAQQTVIWAMKLALLWAEKMGVGDRCTYVAGDMFKEVPPADGYMMKMILHDWNDEECIQILSNIYRAAPQNGRVFVIEHVIPDPDPPHFSKLF